MSNQSKRRKGQVGVSSYNGVLRLSLPRFLFEGKRKYLYLGLKDNPKNCKAAELKAQQIEADIFHERFDPTLERYRPQKTVTIEQPKTTQTLSGLYQQYIEIKRPTVRPGTWKNSYKVMLHHIQRSPYTEIDPQLENTGYAQKLFDWATQALTADTCHRLMIEINACLKWAIESRQVKLTRSPFEGMATKAKKLIKKSEDDKTDIHPFTRSERDAIIEAFKTSSHHCNYYYYVVFCFYVGCRPSEAIALTWNDISSDLSKITFKNVIVAGVNGNEKCAGLKTQKKRVFPCNKQVQKLLRELAQTHQSNQNRVFPAAKGGVINIGYFRKIWAKTLKNLRIEYRKPYQMRHTFITLCLEAGQDAKDVARLVGNSPEMIYRHYAGQRTELSVPEI